jgi:hypothetical protein
LIHRCLYPFAPTVRRKKFAAFCSPLLSLIGRLGYIALKMESQKVKLLIADILLAVNIVFIGAIAFIKATFGYPLD